MNTTKFEHVIGRDGQHRIRKTCVETGEIIVNSHEGFSSRHEAQRNAADNLEADILLAGSGESFSKILAAHFYHVLSGIPTVDERLTNDPLESQTPEN